MNGKLLFSPYPACHTPRTDIPRSPLACFFPIPLIFLNVPPKNMSQLLVRGALKSLSLLPLSVVPSQAPTWQTDN
jgi:hypothetical protein